MEPFTIPKYICGDANEDEEINVGDAVYLINYVFKQGPEPLCSPITSCAAVNEDGSVNVGDAVYLINYVFKNGPAPVVQERVCYGEELLKISPKEKYLLR